MPHVCFIIPFVLQQSLSNFNPGLQLEEKTLENFGFVKYKPPKERRIPLQRTSYDLLGNHTHRIAEAMNLAGDGGERGKGEGKK